MSADSPRRSSGSTTRGMVTIPATVPPQVVSDRSILDSAIGFINEVTLAHQPPIDPKDTITWARFETAADISDPRFGHDWELEGNVAPPLLLILGYGLGVQVWAIPANGEAVEVLSWRHGIVSTLTVLPVPLPTVAVEENGRADEPIDAFSDKRPLIALVDGSSTSGSQPQFCSVNFISLRTGAQVKTIKFKNPVIDILANRSSIVITFHERIAVFDARTLEDRLSITTCYPSPGINPNPAALGSRWLAYAENKLLHSKRSGGGCDGDGVASYTATVLNASKSLVKGLRELGEQVAAGLTGTSGSAINSKSMSFESSCGVDTKQSGIVTIIDVKNAFSDYSPTTSGTQTAGNEAIIAHFIAHSEALVAIEFDNSGMLLVTADRRGHDFHVFRIQPNPVDSSLAAVHHLYILHRGDTSAKVQNITLTLDSRWVAVSTLRGTTHVFPITPYGGAMGVRTHTSLHVVNKLSRFHRSAGLSAEGRSNSPISHSESTTFTQSLQPYHNSTLPPFPRPTVVMPLAQLRQPFALGSPPGSASLAGVKSVAGSSGSVSQRQRLSSLSDDSGKPLSVCAIFAKSRSWLLDPPNVTREAPHRIQRKAVDSLFIMAGHGALIQYDLDTKLASNVAKEKICDDTPIELEVEAKAQWNLGRRKEGSQDIMPPLPLDHWLIKNRSSCMLTDSTRQYDDSDDRTESWLSQVEIITHAGPHRRLWMGPQFVFKTYNTPSGSNLSHVDIEAVEIGTSKSCTSTSEKLDYSSPLNMPLTATGRSSAVPVLIESGSYSSIEQSPKLMDRFRHDHLDSDFSVTHGDSRLKEDLADAMRESPSATASSKDTDGHGCERAGSSDNVAFYDALTAEDDQGYIHARSASAAALANVLPNIHSYDNSSCYESLDSVRKTAKASIEKIVNPLGTVTTVTSCLTADVKTDILDEVVSQLATEDTIIHENCDESLFRPVVAIFCDQKTILQNEEETRKHIEEYQPPENVSSKLVVPVIVKEVNDELDKREKQKTVVSKHPNDKDKEQSTLNDWSLLNKKHKDIELKVRKTIKLKEQNNVGVYTLDEEKSQNGKSSMLRDENLRDESLTAEIVCQKKKCSKNVTKEKSTNMTPPTQLCSSKDMTIKERGNPLEDLDEKSVDVAARKQLQKPLEESEFSRKIKEPTTQMVFEDNNAIDSDVIKTVENMETKDKQNKGENILNMPKISKENKDIFDLKLTATILLKTDKKKPNNENFTNKSTYNKNETPNTLVKTDTAVKVKENKSQNFVKTSKSEVSDELEEQIVEIKGKAKTTEEISSKEIKETENKVESENIIEAVSEELEPSKSTLNLRNDNIAGNHLSEDNGKSHTKKMNSRVDYVCKSSGSLSKIIERKEAKEIEACVKEIKKSDEKVIKCKGKDELATEANVSKTKKFKPVISDNFDPLYSSKEFQNDIMLKKKSPDGNVNTTPRSKVRTNFELPFKNEDIIRSEEFGKDKQIKNQYKKEKLFELERKPEEVRKEISTDTKIISFNVKQMDVEYVGHELTESAKSRNKDITDDCKLFQDNIKPEKREEGQERSCKSEINLNLTQDVKMTNMDLRIKQSDKNLKSENKSSALNMLSQKKKGKGTLNDDVKKDVNLSILKKECAKESLVKNDVTEYCNQRLKDNLNAKQLLGSTSGVCEKSNVVTNKIQTTPAPPTSAWKTLSGADMINKNLSKSDDESISVNFPSLGPLTKLITSKKLLPELPTPIDIPENTKLDELSILKCLDPLPPLPTLEPLELMLENKCSTSKDVSLINFESPLQENPAFQRKITPIPRGFTEQNLILALCGSLHYENEHATLASIDKSELSPTLSSTHSSVAFEDPSLADYKSLTENDDPYMSLEQSSQDTNTTTTNTTNDKFSSSNSSGSEEIVIMEEKKMTKKQKRKKQQQLKELQKQKDQQQHKEIDDEELRPLIAMTESQIDQTANGSEKNLQTIAAKCNKKQSLATQSQVHSTTTDSEGPMPATTSDDNICPVPVPAVQNPHKIKTKKLEHKINLIAAIEAATSSSTSSAEESGVELGGRSSQDNEESLISVSSSISTIPLPIAATSQTAVGALKKKTKRRKR